jgi:glycosyltransferase involved in cell wall biosynthesis
MSSPLVSVIIPAFNRAAVLPQSAGSVLAQTMDDLELIIVDDFSTDSTADVATSFGDPRVRLVRHETNRGVSAARNSGVVAARGRFLAFLDSDDTWLPEKLAIQTAQLEAAAQPDRTHCSHAFEMELGRTKVAWPKRGPHAGEPVSDYLFAENGQLQTSTWLLARELFAKFQFDENLRRHEDWDVLLRLAANGTGFLHISQALARRDTGDSTSRLSNLNDALWSERFLEERRTLFTPRAALAFRARIVATQFVRAGRRGPALARWWAAFSGRAIAPAAALKLGAQLFTPRLWMKLLQLRSLKRSHS